MTSLDRGSEVALRRLRGHRVACGLSAGSSSGQHCGSRPRSSGPRRTARAMRPRRRSRRGRGTGNFRSASDRARAAAGLLHRACRGQAGDGVDHLARAVVFEFASALDPADRCQARPILVETRRQLGAHGDAPRLDAAVALFNRFGPLQIGRIMPLGRSSDRLGGNNMLEGETSPKALSSSALQFRLVAFDEQEVIGRRVLGWPRRSASW